MENLKSWTESDSRGRIFQIHTYVMANSDAIAQNKKEERKNNDKNLQIGEEKKKAQSFG